MEGFTADVPVRGLSELTAALVVDIGSGLLRPDPLLPDEPDAARTLRDGATVVTGSGDKLLGGPQAGLILGEADVVGRLRRHPLARALRIDKVRLAALEATLAGPPSPTERFLHAEPDELHRRCVRLAQGLAGVVAVEVVPSDGVVGGGGAPGLRLPGWALALPAGLAGALRSGMPAVVGRVERDRCLLDLRCVPPHADADLCRAVIAAAGR
jgi:L-seryl-tRNA(Ser) seleniumtransferase